MFIEVTSRAQIIDSLLRGATLWCRETGEGWQLCLPGELPHPHFRSKRAVRRFVAHCYADARYWSKQDVIHFRISWE